MAEETPEMNAKGEDTEPFRPRRSWRRLARMGLYVVAAGMLLGAGIAVFGK
jgi:hypothetical protein